MTSIKRISVLFLALLLGYACKDSPIEPSKITANTKAIDTLLALDSTIIKEYLPYRSKMIKEINKKLSFAPKTITRTDGNMQSSLGNMMADLMFDKANELFQKETGKKVDFVLSNYGGIRAEIGKGEVKVIHAFNLMPFENTIVVAELTKEKTEELFEYFAVRKRAHPISKQVQITFEKNGDVKILVNGKPLEEGKTYFVSTSNYLQKGGDNMNFFINPESLYDSNYLVRDAITEYFKENDTLKAELDNRVIIK